MANGHDLYPGSGLADELISANAMRPYANTFKDIYQGMMEGRKVANAEQQARDIEKQRRFMREEAQRKAREAAYPTSGGGTTGGTTGSTGGTGGTGILSGEVAGVPYSVRSESDILAELLAPGTASLQSAQVGDMFSDKGLMARIARGKAEAPKLASGGEVAGRASAVIGPEEVPLKTDPVSRTFAPGPPAGTERRGEPSADKFMAKVAGIDDKAKQERMDTTRLIQSLVKGGLIPEETLYSGTPEEAAEEISNLLAGLSPGVLQQRIESVEGYEGVPMADFERLKAEAAKMSSQELQEAHASARAEGLKGAIAVLKSDPVFARLSDGAASHLANLQMTEKGFGRYEAIAKERGLTDRNIRTQETSAENNRRTTGVYHRKINIEKENQRARDKALRDRYDRRAEDARDAAADEAAKSARGSADAAATEYDKARTGLADRGLDHLAVEIRRFQGTMPRRDLVEEMARMLVDSGGFGESAVPTDMGTAREQVEAALRVLELDTERAVLADKATAAEEDRGVLMSGGDPDILLTEKARATQKQFDKDLASSALEAKGKSSDPMHYETRSDVSRESQANKFRIAEARNDARALANSATDAGGLGPDDAANLAHLIADTHGLDESGREMLLVLTRTTVGRKQLIRQAKVGTQSDLSRLLDSGLLSGSAGPRTGGGGSRDKTVDGKRISEWREKRNPEGVLYEAPFSADGEMLASPTIKR